MGELQIEESLYKSKKEMEETHLGKIEQDAEKRIGVLEKERDKYNVDKNQKMKRNLEIQTALVKKTSIEEDTGRLKTLRTQVQTKKSEVDKQREFFVKNDDCPVCEQPIKKTFKTK